MVLRQVYAFAKICCRAAHRGRQHWPHDTKTNLHKFTSANINGKAIENPFQNCGNGFFFLLVNLSITFSNLTSSECVLIIKTIPVALIAVKILQIVGRNIQMEKKTFSIPNISCGHCVNAIKTELTELDGVSTVEGDIEGKSVEVEWDTPATENIIKNKLAEINYPAA
jgi:copper chaperone